jgi:branched-chain amino acid transport system ATP-binding protein
LRQSGTIVKEMLSLGAANTYRGPAQILRDLSLVVREGETVCLIGRNGAGKTTTMESIMGLLPMRSGRVTLGGQEITRLGAHARARLGIGYAPDDCGIFPDLTVAENLGIGHWLGETSRRAGGSGGQATRSEAMYGLFPELPRLLQRRGLHLSGGERKMVAIARCMALGPSVLLLDEAFEGLAPMVVNRFADAVQKIKAMGISMLIAESNVMTAAKVAERFYVIDRGEIIFQGTPAEVFANKEIMQVIRG